MRSTWYAPVLTAALCISVIGCEQEPGSPTGPEPGPGPALDATTTSTLSFSGMTAGDLHSCGVTTDQRAFCWGSNSKGALGAGISNPNQVLPTAVAGGLGFRQLSAGFTSTCGVTVDYRAYCWGGNDRGELGDGTTTQHAAPVAVAGGHRFKQVEVAFEHTCGLTYPDNKAYCWGWNGEGQLGIGNNTGPEVGQLGPHSTKPVAVLGGLTFLRITTGYNHTCGVTTGHKVYCWGLNKEGQLGDGTTVSRRKTPKLVAGTLRFTWVDAGAQHTCAVADGGKAYCWGFGQDGQRGDGGVAERARAPLAVFGNHLYVRVSAAVRHTCGVTTSNQAWCWGSNTNGQLGDGTVSQHLTPHAVVGGLDFNEVSTGDWHTCGRTTTGTGYCWGAGYTGQFGNGMTSDSWAPVAVRTPAD